MQILINAVSSGAVLAIVAIGFALVQRVTRVFHIAHGALYTIGSYATFWLAASQGVPLAIAALLAVLVSGVGGLLIEWFVYRPLAVRRSSELVTLLSSLGVYILVVNLVAAGFGADTKLARSGTAPTLNFGDMRLTDVQLGQVILAPLVIGSLVIWLRRSATGRSLVAVSEHVDLASVIGINAWRSRAVAVLLGGVMAGIGGMAHALDRGITPGIGMPVFVSAAVATVIGGTRRIEGAAIAGLLLGLLEGVVVWVLSDRWVSAVTLAVLLMFLLVRPGGLLGLAARRI